jgi:hypothetical protein
MKAFPQILKVCPCPSVQVFLLDANTHTMLYFSGLVQQGLRV